MSSFVFSTFSSIFESYLTTYRSYTAGSSPTSTYQLLTSTQQKGEKQKPNQVAQNACFVFFFFLIYLLIYLFMAVLGLRFCARAFSSCGKPNLLSEQILLPYFPDLESTAFALSFATAQTCFACLDCVVSKKQMFSLICSNFLFIYAWFSLLQLNYCWISESLLSLLE